MWRPGFAHDEAVPARICGLHRSLCIFSWVHRGTQTAPGLVLGLDRGGSCIGTAFRVTVGSEAEVVNYLREREQVTMVYQEARRKAALQDGSGRKVEALVYLVDRNHEQYAGKLPLVDQLEIVRNSRGKSGHNQDYVLSTARHLMESGVRDRALEWLANGLAVNPV
jgi:cation transport protein ChaC